MSREEPTLYDAISALNDNMLNHLSPKSAPILHNLNIALQGICRSLDKLERDVSLVHSKLQPVLKAISDDQDDIRDLTRGSPPRR